MSRYADPAGVVLKPLREIAAAEHAHGLALTLAGDLRDLGDQIVAHGHTELWDSLAADGYLTRLRRLLTLVDTAETTARTLSSRAAAHAEHLEQASQAQAIATSASAT